MESLSDLEEVLARAVRVYVLAKKRAALLRDPDHPTLSLEKLARDYPESLQPYERGGVIRYRPIGLTGDDILEEYLSRFGYARNSELWYSLAHIVIERGEHESTRDPDLV